MSNSLELWEIGKKISYSYWKNFVVAFLDMTRIPVKCE